MVLGILGLGFRVWGLGFRGFGFRVFRGLQGSGGCRGSFSFRVGSLEAFGGFGGGFRIP